MFKLGESFTLSDIELPEQAISLRLIWIDLSKLILKVPNKHLENWHTPGSRKGYWLGKYPLTQAQWQAIAIPPKEDVDPTRINYPASGIDWIQAMEYCRLLNLRYKDSLPTGYHFSLSTEAYWVYAIEGGDEYNYRKIAQQELKNLGYSDVGQEKTNHLGFCDMQSNVREWCYDMYVEYSDTILNEISNVDINNVSNSDGEMRTTKGWENPYWKEYRLADNGASWKETFRPSGIGFRVCLRPIFDWPNCDLNDPLLIEEGINMLE